MLKPLHKREHFLGFAKSVKHEQFHIRILVSWDIDILNSLLSAMKEEWRALR
jgi:hypothetical protein